MSSKSLKMSNAEGSAEPSDKSERKRDSFIHRATSKETDKKDKKDKDKEKDKKDKDKNHDLSPPEPMKEKRRSKLLSTSHSSKENNRESRKSLKRASTYNDVQLEHEASSSKTVEVAGSAPGTPGSARSKKTLPAKPERSKLKRVNTSPEVQAHALISKSKSTEALQQTIDSLYEEKAIMRQNLQLYTENLKLTVDSKGDLENRLSEAKSEVNTLRQQLTTAQAEIVKQLSSPNERIQELKAKNQKLKEKISALQATQLEKQTELITAQTELKLTQTTQLQLNEKNEKLKAKINKIKESAPTNETNGVDNTKALKAEIESLQAQLREARAQSASTACEIETKYKSQIHTLTLDLDAARTQATRIQNEYTFYQQQTALHIKKLTDELEHAPRTIAAPVPTRPTPFGERSAESTRVMHVESTHSNSLVPQKPTGPAVSPRSSRYTPREPGQRESPDPHSPRNKQSLPPGTGTNEKKRRSTSPTKQWPHTPAPGPEQRERSPVPPSASSNPTTATPPVASPAPANPSQRASGLQSPLVRSNPSKVVISLPEPEVPQEVEEEHQSSSGSSDEEDTYKKMRKEYEKLMSKSNMTVQPTPAQPLPPPSPEEQSEDDDYEKLKQEYQKKLQQSQLQLSVQASPHALEDDEYEKLKAEYEASTVGRPSGQQDLDDYEKSVTAVMSSLEDESKTKRPVSPTPARMSGVHKPRPTQRPGSTTDNAAISRSSQSRGTITRSRDAGEPLTDTSSTPPLTPQNSHNVIQLERPPITGVTISEPDQSSQALLEQLKALAADKSSMPTFGNSLSVTVTNAYQGSHDLLFQVNIKTDMRQFGHLLFDHLDIWRSYADFEDLHKKLSSSFPGFPKMPKKKLGVGAEGPLNEMMAYITADPMINSLTVFVDFFDNSKYTQGEKSSAVQNPLKGLLSTIGTKIKPS